jgi:hypothetical protein
MNERHYLVSLYHDLAVTLGDAVWAFAKIEWLTYEALNQLSVDHKLGEIVGDVAFKSRTAMLKRLIERKNVDAERKERAFDAIKVVDRLADNRNVIVHNPWRVWVDLDKKDFMTEIQKYANPARKFDLSQLRLFVDQATVAEINLREAFRALDLP